MNYVTNDNMLDCSLWFCLSNGRYFCTCVIERGAYQESKNLDFVFNINSDTMKPQPFERSLKTDKLALLSVYQVAYCNCYLIAIAIDI